MEGIQSSVKGVYSPWDVPLLLPPLEGEPNHDLVSRQQQLLASQQIRIKQRLQQQTAFCVKRERNQCISPQQAIADVDFQNFQVVTICNTDANSFDSQQSKLIELINRKWKILHAVHADVLDGCFQKAEKDISGGNIDFGGGEYSDPCRNGYGSPYLRTRDERFQSNAQDATEAWKRQMYAAYKGQLYLTQAKMWRDYAAYLQMRCMILRQQETFFKLQPLAGTSDQLDQCEERNSNIAAGESSQMGTPVAPLHALPSSSASLEEANILDSSSQSIGVPESQQQQREERQPLRGPQNQEDANARLNGVWIVFAKMLARLLREREREELNRLAEQQRRIFLENSTGNDPSQTHLESDCLPLSSADVGNQSAQSGDNEQNQIPVQPDGDSQNDGSSNSVVHGSSSNNAPSPPSYRECLFYQTVVVFFMSLIPFWTPDPRMIARHEYSNDNEQPRSRAVERNPSIQTDARSRVTNDAYTSSDYRNNQRGQNDIVNEQARSNFADGQTRNDLINGKPQNYFQNEGTGGTSSASSVSRVEDKIEEKPVVHPSVSLVWSPKEVDPAAEVHSLMTTSTPEFPSIRQPKDQQYGSLSCARAAAAAAAEARAKANVKTVTPIPVGIADTKVPKVTVRSMEVTSSSSKEALKRTSKGGNCIQEAAESEKFSISASATASLMKCDEPSSEHLKADSEFHQENFLEEMSDNGKWHVPTELNDEGKHTFNIHTRQANFKR